MKWLCDLLGCKADCSLEEIALRECLASNDELEVALWNANDRIRQLELIVPRPAPPKVDLIVQRDTTFIQAALDKMNLGIVRLPLDQTYYLTDQSNFLNIVAWDWTDSIDYLRETFDCENFAFLFKANIDLFFHLNQVGLVIDYQAGHAYNLVVYPNGGVQIIEPQSDGLWFWNVRPDVYNLQGAIVLI